LHSTARLSVRPVTADSIVERDVAAWSALEDRALEPNAYLSPYFVLPAIRRLAPRTSPAIVFVERSAAGRTELLAVGVFVEAAPNVHTPVRRLATHWSKYAPLGGLLLHRDHAVQAFGALLDYVKQTAPDCKLIELAPVWNDGPMTGADGIIARCCGVEPVAVDTVPRAILVLSKCQSYLESRLLSQRIRDLGRRMRRLRERGEVSWHCHWRNGVPAAAIESLLALEHMGWKGTAHSSLRSHPADEAFFREMIAGFASERRAVLTELTLDGTPIACSSNLLSGKTGFAFKIGWHPDFRTFSPGWINELEFMQRAPAEFPGCDYFDSGARPDSFINELWPDRRALSTLLVPTQLSGRVAIAALTPLRRLKRRLTRISTLLPHVAWTRKPA